MDLEEVNRVYSILEEERRQIIYLEGNPITGRDYPPCLEQNTPKCEKCWFFDDNCRLRKSKRLREAVWEIIEPWVEQEKRRLKQKNKVKKAIEKELKAHGRELHYTILTKMLQERYPKLKVSEKGVLRILRSSSDTFEQLNPGVYRLASSTSTSQRD